MIGPFLGYHLKHFTQKDINNFTTRRNKAEPTGTKELKNNDECGKWAVVLRVWQANKKQLSDNS